MGEELAKSSVEMEITHVGHNAIHGHTPGEVEQDQEGVQTLVNLAKNMVWLLKMCPQTQGSVQTPDSLKMARTNFIK